MVADRVEPQRQLLVGEVPLALDDASQVLLGNALVWEIGGTIRASRIVPSPSSS